MNNMVAKHICASAIRCASMLEQVLPFAKAYCDDAEYQTLLLAVAKASSAIHDEVIAPILQKHSEIKTEIDKSVSTYGVVI